MKLSQWAKLNGISYVTAYRWFQNNQIPNAKQMPSGTIIIQNQNENPLNSQITEVSIYCRVSSHNKKQDLERQAQRCMEFCTKNGFIIKQTIKEIASGMNDKRPKLIKLLQSKPQTILVEHKDRLTRFGFNYFDILLPMLNVNLIVINKEQEETNDLMKDLISVITSFCCRLYGIRKAQNKINKIKKELNNE